MLSHSLLSNGGLHADDREENDFYATEPAAADLLEKAEKMSPFLWECACGKGHLSRRFLDLGHKVVSTDLIARGFGGVFDFLSFEDIYKIRGIPVTDYDIVTNPPYRLTESFIRHAFGYLGEGRKLCLFLKLTFLESVARDDLFKRYPVSRIHVCRKRIKCAKNGDFSKVQSSPTCYAWFVWEKGYTGPTIIDRV